MFIDHPKIHEQVRGQHLQLEVAAFDVHRRGVPHQLEHGICQRACAKHLGLIQVCSHARGRLWQRHQARARALVQGFDQCLHLVFEHAGHEPLTALFVDLVECKQRHLHRDTVFGVPRLMQIGG